LATIEVTATQVNDILSMKFTEHFR